MSKMREPEESTGFGEFLRQDIQEELIAGGRLAKRARAQGRPERKGGVRRISGWVLIRLFSAFLLAFILSCQHTPDILPEPDKTVRIFEADERIILKAVARVFKDRGFGDAKIDKVKSRLDTDYVVQEDWRTKVEAAVKKLNRREREVTLSVITEKKTSSGWQFRRILEREQYEKIFSEIELQIYREMSTAE